MAPMKIVKKLIVWEGLGVQPSSWYEAKFTKITKLNFRSKTIMDLQQNI